MKGIRKEYESAKQALASNQSGDNYKELMSVCYEILAYHRELCQEEEFADTLQLSVEICAEVSCHRGCGLQCLSLYPALSFLA